MLPKLRPVTKLTPTASPTRAPATGRTMQQPPISRTPNADGQFYTSPNPNQVPLPPVSSNQPPTDPTKADLSLSLSSSNLVVTPNQTVTITLSIYNRGGATATGLSLQTLLPPGWQLTSTNGLTVSGQTVTGTISNIPAGGSGTLTLSIQASGTGTLQAQIATASPSDPDSTPGNGYDNGEDDTVSVMVRVR